MLTCQKASALVLPAVLPVIVWTHLQTVRLPTTDPVQVAEDKWKCVKMTPPTWTSCSRRSMLMLPHLLKHTLQAVIAVPTSTQPTSVRYRDCACVSRRRLVRLLIPQTHVGFTSIPA